MSQERNLEENLLSQAAENTLSSQLDEAETIEVDVQTDLLKIIQGQADAVSLSGEGLEIQGIRIQEIEVQTDKIAINPLSAIFGQIELNQPVNTTARIILTEADINHALTSESIRSKIQNFDLNVDGEIISLKPQKIQIGLPDDGKIKFHGTVLIKEKRHTRQIAFTAVVSPRTIDKPILIESFNCDQGEGISLDMIVSLMNKVKELVNLPYFEFDNTKFRLINMEVRKGNMILLVEANVKRIPTL
ncbi:DUF2993 domain-containing protein [Chlorogloeopsis sp. ULAP01]|uniref:LmeA family phospholipid-binding protein n=1 Tax=Chlorogloeopsis sp. ULAP01 TaxID=3056483 RepID=UPI0025AB4D3D|nr:DUF2993 domain-containing protein [Chlorogloeopsis sp. ULAP01]MDM9385554.1 DUF2993 domain-containing protein [Chlorogloeopsis sp. ULAP01]